STADDDDLLVLAEDTAGGAEVGGDGLTKRREPGRERVAHGVRAGVAGAPREETCPERERKLGESRNAGLEGDRTGVFGSPDGRERAAAERQLGRRCLHTGARTSTSALALGV